jgi:hypothetical protein
MPDGRQENTKMKNYKNNLSERLLNFASEVTTPPLLVLSPTAV